MDWVDLVEIKKAFSWIHLLSTGVLVGTTENRSNPLKQGVLWLFTLPVDGKFNPLWSVWFKSDTEYCDLRWYWIVLALACLAVKNKNKKVIHSFWIVQLVIQLLQQKILADAETDWVFFPEAIFAMLRNPVLCFVFVCELHCDCSHF